jgi:hypothetical protein
VVLYFAVDCRCDDLSDLGKRSCACDTTPVLPQLQPCAGMWRIYLVIRFSSLYYVSADFELARLLWKRIVVFVWISTEKGKGGRGVTLGFVFVL